MATDKAARLAAIRAANSHKRGAALRVATTRGRPDRASRHGMLSRRRVPLARRFQAILMVMLAGVGVLIVAALFEIWRPAIRDALPEIDPNTCLLLSRGSALVGYGLLWASMLLGLTMSSRAPRIWPGRVAALRLHRHISLLGLLFAAFHVVILLADPLLDYTLAKALLPYTGSSYRPLWVGLMGKVALYSMTIVVASFYLRSRIGGRWWRRLHSLSFIIFLLTLLHGLFAGTDTPMLWTQVVYAVSTASLVGLAGYRVLKTRPSRIVVVR